MASPAQIVAAAERRAAVLAYVKRSITTRGYPPTYTEVGAEFGVNPETAKVDLRVLVDEGYLESDPGVNRGIRVAGHDVVLVPRAQG